MPSNPGAGRGGRVPGHARNKAIAKKAGRGRAKPAYFPPTTYVRTDQPPCDCEPCLRAAEEDAANENLER